MIRQLQRLESCYREAARVARDLAGRIRAGNGALDQSDLEKGLEIRARALLSAQDLSGLVVGAGSQSRFRSLTPAQRDQAIRLTAQARAQAESALEAGEELFRLLSAERDRTRSRIKAVGNGQRLMRGYKGFKTTAANLNPALRG